MVLSRLFKPRPQLSAAKALYAGAVAAARRPALYTRLAAPDTREGRFELYGLHVYLLMDRLKGQGEEAHETSQYLIEALVTGLDDAFHEMGVGHVVVPRRVKKLAGVFLGRVKVYDEALAQPDDEVLQSLIARTLYGGPASEASLLVAHVRAERAHLANQPLAQLLTGEATWKEI